MCHSISWLYVNASPTLSTHPAHLGYVWSLGVVKWWFPWGLNVALAPHQSLLYPRFPTFINSKGGGNRGTIALSWKLDPKIESVILVLFSFSRKARKDYGIMAGHGKRPLTPLLYWLGPVPTPPLQLSHHVAHASSTSLPPPGEDLPTHDFFLPYGWIQIEPCSVVEEVFTYPATSKSPPFNISLQPKYRNIISEIIQQRQKRKYPCWSIIMYCVILIIFYKMLDYHWCIHFRSVLQLQLLNVELIWTIFCIVGLFTKSIFYKLIIHLYIK